MNFVRYADDNTYTFKNSSRIKELLENVQEHVERFFYGFLPITS